MAANLKSAKKKVVKQIMDWAVKVCGGSGDIEKQDAVHFSDLLCTSYKTRPDQLAGTIKAVRSRLEIVDPTWAYRRTPVSTVTPPQPAAGVIATIFLSPLSLGFEEGFSDKGKSKMIHIFERIQNFLERPYNSVGNPLFVRFAHKTIAMAVKKTIAKHKKGPMMAIYAHTSSKTNLHGDSHDWQLGSTSKAMRVAGGYQVPMSQVRKVKECISGMLPLAQRNKLQKLINGKHDAVYVESLRALGRKATVIEDVYEMAKNSKTKIVVADMPGVFNPKASATENFLRRVQAAVQEYECDIIVHQLMCNGHESLLENKPPTTHQKHMLKAVCKEKKCGALGWCPLAMKCAKILKISHMSHVTARAIFDHIISKKN